MTIRQQSKALHSLRQELRSNLRQKRNLLSSNEQNLAAEALLHRYQQQQQQQQQPSLHNRVLASYVADDGEIDPKPLLSTLQNANIYLPYVDTSDNMRWLEYTSDEQLIKGRWQILHPNPSTSQQLPDNTALDTVLVPLVAFDRKGQRLGRGGGFYDKLLAQLPEKTIAIGLAHHFQEVEKVPIMAWDQALDYIITDRETIDCATYRATL